MKRPGIRKPRNLRLMSFLLVALLLGSILTIDRLGAMANTKSTLIMNLDDADLTLVGEEIGDWSGYFASPAGDINGDGLGDVLVGSPMAGNKICPYPLNPDGTCPGLAKGEGVAYLVLGRPSESWLTTPLDLGQADASFLGCETTSMTARQLYTAGDVNGDGFDDMLISGWKCGENYTGKAYLILGREDINYWDDYHPLEQSDASFLGENEGDFLSYYVSTAGDVNADGLDDIVISSTHYDISGTDVISDAGKIYLMLGREAADWGLDYPLSQADASFVGEAEGDRIGRTVTGVGDVDGDGFDDFLIGSISSDSGGVNGGESYLFLGRASPSDPDYDLNRPWWPQNFSVAHADASFMGESGIVEDDRTGDESGRRVARAGDVNNDGYDDFIIGSALNDHSGLDAGIAHLILGRATADWGMRFPLSQADASFTGEEPRDQAGRRVSGAGDVNDDGYDDFLVGAPHNERGGEIAGTAYLIYGRETADWGSYYPLEDADMIFVGKPEVGVAGYDVGWIGDYNGDGIDDLLIAAYGGRNNEVVAGETYVILGNKAPIPFQFLPDRPSGEAPIWYRFTGDIWEPNGWVDIDEVHLLLGRSLDDPRRIQVKYEKNEGTLYLYDNNESQWLGPCTIGELQKVSSSISELDCRGSIVTNDGMRSVRVMWRVRWLVPYAYDINFNVYLKAVDQSGNESDFVEFGTWTLLHGEFVFLPLVARQ